ncbi:glutamine--tRNA ligase/YqeY domain fusion protein [Geobacter sp. DSM 9736]|uniref:glutamine--tRNA ligase/YqeY domain fusion protein n=1 Tax=Geobacter sp. DSM 9736 TaxID=1277350 RepID=UPI000B5082FC|nr:glutamine--tRNA ligase/YqeY domain fusion protein [Geobacter sp. DSM 9736]SNB47680.1 glutaminyl-tRNA synthetase [Geobacter sp. DSM 9736]
MNSPTETDKGTSTGFLRNIIEEDLRAGKHASVVTRFPPEPNGYLHIGHAKSICINFGLARDFGGRCHLRFDDTNPVKEEEEYAESIKESVHWLGFDWGEHLYYASDYFEQLYRWAEQLITQGDAYVDDLSAEEIREYRGTLTEPGRESPHRNRSAEENLSLFRRMRSGEFKDGSRVLRARIDMASPNLNMRDPVMYRILHAPHPHTGDAWCIYPMYDFAHGQSDSIEGITHSICTLEFEDHRPLYEWFLDRLGIYHPRQYEFARLNLTYTVMSKRKLLQLVQDGDVRGWDDPRMPTLVGFRRRGYTPQSIRNFCERIGVGKSDSWIDMSILEESVREDLNVRAPRAMAVLRPVRLVIENYPEDRNEEFLVANHPQDPEMGTRQIPFCRELYIERDDFMEEPPKGFHRLAPGREVRLRYAYIVTCTGVVKDAAGNVTEIRCTYDPDTNTGGPAAGRKVKGIIHWVSARHGFNAEIRLYDRLISVPNPSGDDWKRQLNPESMEILSDSVLEPALRSAEPEAVFQFERQGYFCADRRDSAPGMPVFNRTVTLRDSWKKAEEAK